MKDLADALRWAAIVNKALPVDHEADATAARAVSRLDATRVKRKLTNKSKGQTMKIYIVIDKQQSPEQQHVAFAVKEHAERYLARARLLIHMKPGEEHAGAPHIREGELMSFDMNPAEAVQVAYTAECANPSSTATPSP